MAQGRNLFSHKRYAQAVLCFKKAKAYHEETVANACLLYQQARTNAKVSDRKNMFEQAAREFKKCTETSSRRITEYYSRAAKCYVKAGMFCDAAEASLKAELFSDAAQFFRKAAKFEAAAQVIKDHGNHIPQNIRESIMAVTRLHFFRGSDSRLVQ